MTPLPWYALSAADVAGRLDVDPRQGLSSAEARVRQLRFGPNTVPQAPPPSFLTLLLRQVMSFIVLLLLGTVALSLVLGEIGDAVAILAAVALNAVVGLLMDWRAERAIASLQELTAPEARVRRDGHELQLPAAELVPGDVVLLGAGDRVPADARLILGACSIDESLLSGESLPVDKQSGPLAGTESQAPPLSERHNEVFAGSLVRTGAGVALVTAIGEATEIGRIGRLLRETKRPPVPLNLRLAALGRYIVWTVLAVNVLMMGLGVWQGRPFWPLLRTSVVLGVAAIPEGLPSVATLALAAGARRLARRKLRLRYLGILEALGSIDTLCLDKTGTLTANAMTVRAIHVAGHALTVTGQGYVPTGSFLEHQQPVAPQDLPVLMELLRACQWCNEATLEQEDHGWHIHGDPSEGALLCVAAKAGLADPRPHGKHLHTIAATHEHPWMAVLGEPQPGRPAQAFIKGAPEQVLARCATEHTDQGLVPLGDAARMRWHTVNQALADQALRVFGIACVADAGAAGPEALEQERNWQWLGLCGMADPPREGVKEALAQAHRAGIRTLMITGDQPATAAAIARELDLAAGREPRVVTGADVSISDVDAVARATPEGKYQLVQALQQSGRVVGMSGDGVNDAPALRAADAGIAMGHGTEVAKAAAAIVLIDEQLPTLLCGIEEGRSVFLNIQKALDYLLSCSIATVLTVLITLAVGYPPILLPLQILYLNLLMHTFPALGLTLEPADPETMQRPPLPKAAALLSPAQMGSVLWHGVIIAIATVAIAGWGVRHGGEAHGRALAFAVLSMSLLLHAFSDRSPRMFRGWQIWKNPILTGFVGIALVLQLLALYLPALAELLSMTSFSAHDWVGILGAAVASVIATELSKSAWTGKRPDRL